MPGLNVPQYVQPAAIGHVNVEQHQVPFRFSQRVESFIAAGGFSHCIDARIGFEKLFEPGPDHRMIVSDQYS
jgi:hypothetical protein